MDTLSLLFVYCHRDHVEWIAIQDPFIDFNIYSYKEFIPRFIEDLFPDIIFIANKSKRKINLKNLDDVIDIVPIDLTKEDEKLPGDLVGDCFWNYLYPVTPNALAVLFKVMQGNYLSAESAKRLNALLFIPENDQSREGINDSTETEPRNHNEQRINSVRYKRN